MHYELIAILRPFCFVVYGFNTIFWALLFICNVLYVKKRDSQHENRFAPEKLPNDTPHATLAPTAALATP